MELEERDKHFLYLTDLRRKRDDIRDKAMRVYVYIWSVTAGMIIFLQFLHAFTNYSIYLHLFFSLALLTVQFISLAIVRYKTEKMIKNNDEFKKYDLK